MLDFFHTLFTGRYVSSTRREQIVFFIGMGVIALAVLGLCYLKATYGVDLAHWIEANYPYPLH